MIKIPKILESKYIYEGWLKHRVDKLEFENDGSYEYSIIKIGNGVAVLPFIDEKTILLAKQYRHPVKEELLELIQGGVKKDASIENAAKRELLEETGYSGNMEYLITMYPLSGSLDMRLHIFDVLLRLKSKASYFIDQLAHE